MSILLFRSHRQMTDEELMQRVARDSDSAFEELYRRYARRLQGFFFRQLGGDDEAASDFTHDVATMNMCRTFSPPLMRNLSARKMWR